MTLIELKIKVDLALKINGNEDLEVCIPNNKPSMGPLSTTNVKYVSPGIDWDSKKLLITYTLETKSNTNNPLRSDIKINHEIKENIIEKLINEIQTKEELDKLLTGINELTIINNKNNYPNYNPIHKLKTGIVENNKQIHINKQDYPKPEKECF